MGIFPTPGPFALGMQDFQHGFSHDPVAAEQAHADTLFAHLDAEVARARTRLEEVQRDVDPDNPDSDALVRRETEYHGLNAKLDTLGVA